MALLLETMRSVRPSWIAVRPLPLSTGLRTATASCAVTGCMLISVTRPSIGASLMIVRPATCDRCSSSASSGVFLKFRRMSAFGRVVAEGWVAAAEAAAARGLGRGGVRRRSGRAGRGRGLGFG